MALLEITDYEGDHRAKARVIAGRVDGDCTIDL